MKLLIGTILNSLQEEAGMVVEVANGNKDFPDGMTDSETEKKLAEVWITFRFSSSSYVW